MALASGYNKNEIRHSLEFRNFIAVSQVDPKLAQIRQLQDELWKLEGPSAEEIQAAKAAAQKVPGGFGCDSHVIAWRVL